MSKTEENWFGVIDLVHKNHILEEDEWRKNLGEPLETISTEDEVVGFWKSGDGVISARIGKRGAIRSSVAFFEDKVIEALWNTLNNGGKE
jgi:hypothetical protein